MNTLSTTKNIILTAMALFLLTACGGGSETSNINNASENTNHANTYNTANGEEITLESNNPSCKEGTSYQEGQVKDFDTNLAIKNATVTIGGCSTTTDENGFYKLENILSSNRTSIKISKEGYYKNSKIISIDTETTNYTELKIEKFRSWNPTVYQSNSGKDIGFITIPSNIEYTSNNQNYEGNITAYYRNLKTTTTHGRDMFPGTFEGLNSNNLIVPFVSYDFFVLDLKDENNNPLDISGKITIKVSDIEGTNEEVIPLWYYNYNKGIWVEDGVAQRDENGDYICEISHTGTWSISKPVDTAMGLYRGRIVDIDDNPMSHVRIKATGTNWISNDLTTDSNGVFEIYVVPNEAFTLAAYDYKEKFGSTYNSTIAPVRSGEIVDE